MAVTNFIPQVWSARLLAHLDKAHLRPGAVPRGFGLRCPFRASSAYRAVVHGPSDS